MSAQVREEMPDNIGFVPIYGKATLNGLSAVNISCPQIQANSVVFTQILNVAGTIGVVAVTSITPGVGFSVLSVALNTSTIGWQVIV